MIVEDKQERIKCSFIEIELPFQQGASWFSTGNNRFIRRKASLAREPHGSDMQPHLLKLGRWSHDNQVQELKGALLLTVSYQRTLLQEADGLKHCWWMWKAPESKMCSPGPPFWSANMFRNTMKITPLSFTQHMHAKTDNLTSPSMWLLWWRVISYLLAWDGNTGSIYG